MNKDTFKSHSFNFSKLYNNHQFSKSFIQNNLTILALIWNESIVSIIHDFLSFQFETWKRKKTIQYMFSRFLSNEEEFEVEKENSKRR